MPESADDVTVMEVGTVRRRLTQSTLFPHKVQESNAEEDNGVRCEENGSDGEDEDFGGSQGRKKRRVRVKGTQQAKSAKKTNTEGAGCLNGAVDNHGSPAFLTMKSPRKLREKKRKDTNPKKAKTNNLTDQGFTATSTSPLASGEKVKSIPNLRLEAKLIAEENSRIFGRKQIHPFFSSRKSCKVTQETAEAVANSCTGDKNNSSKSPGPIHVYDSSQDSAPVPDWSHWIFLERSIFDRAHDHKTKKFVDSGSSIDFGQVSCPSYMSFTANGVSGGHLAPKGNSSPHPILIDEDVEHVKDHKSRHEYCFDEKKSSICHSRTKSLNCWDKDVLWTKKYQPERAAEVCGNIESVKYLSEWLKVWHEKAFECRDSAKRGTKSNSQSCDLYYESDCDSEKLSQGAKLKNVLLVSGPTGSGKSASIYACAREQGFNVIEVNTSDWRNGALVKQKFGEALESHRLKRLSESETTYKDNVLDSLSHHAMPQEVDNEIVDLAAVAIGDGTNDSVDISAKVPATRSQLSYDKVQLKTLVLFEDVDIAFSEDRGFISAIQHLAKTAKLPIILTTNSNQTILPESLDSEEICFSRPSFQDLLGHLTEVCTAEKANIEPSLIPKFIEFCQGDIRKTIMHLQFWCQNAARIKGTKMQEEYGPQILDLEAAHQLLLKFIPWGFASVLSELIEFELNKTLNLQEEYSMSTLTDMNEEKHLSDIRKLSFQAHLNEECVAAKKDAMFKRNTYYDQFESEFETQDLSDLSGSPITFSRRNIHRRNDYVLSLSGDDDMYAYECPDISAQEEPHAGDDLVDFGFQTCSPKPEENFRLSIATNNEISLSQTDAITMTSAENFESQVQLYENNSQVQDSCGVVDISCVPESSYVPETRINDEQEGSCRSVSYVPLGDITAIDVQCYDECLSRSHSSSQNVISGYDNVESVHIEDVGDSHTGHFEVSTRQWQLMDECSQMNFNNSAPMKPKAVTKKTSSVQDTWARLRESHQDLGKYVTSKEKNASRFLKVAFGATNFILEADILLSDFWLARNISAEPSTMPSEKSYTMESYKEQLCMASSFSAHGLSLYAKEATADTSNMDRTSLVGSAHEMLTYSSDSLKIGAQGAGTSESRPWETLDSDGGIRRCVPSERDVNFNRLDIIRSIVPPRSYLGVRGEALHEYISSLSMISRSETSRLSAGVDKSKRRRGRLSRHYLIGELSLSPEDISILTRYPFGSHQENA